MDGKIVLTVGAYLHAQDRSQGGVTPEQKARLDELHLRKIDLADRVLILNVDGYIGESTRRELAYAFFRGKPVSYLDDAAGVEYVERYAHPLGQLVAQFTAEAAQ